MTEQVVGRLHENNVYDEGEVASGATVTPGMGIERVGTTEKNDPVVQPVSSVEPVNAQTRFAIEQRLPPRSEGEEMLEDEYEAGNYLQFYVFQRGDVVENALVAAGGDLATASEATIEVGDKVAFSDDGTLKAATTDGAAVGEAREAVDNSGASSGDHARISIEVL